MRSRFDMGANPRQPSLMQRYGHGDHDSRYRPPAGPARGALRGAEAVSLAQPSGDGPHFELIAGDPSPIPVLISVPHAGRRYPADVLARLRYPEMAALRLEDRLADLLGEAVARETGAGLLVARCPRAVIDLNRGPQDIDWTMFTSGFSRGDGQPATPMAHGVHGRARNGLGLVPRRLPGMGELWKGPTPLDELDRRLSDIHEPYHGALKRGLAGLQARWGAALLIDLHSMPPLPARVMEGPVPHLVLGDRFGASCHGTLIAAAFASLAEGRWRLGHNRPYAGGYVLDRHGAPRRGLHAFQLEIDRSCYLDSRLVEPGAGFGDMVALLVRLVRRLSGEVAALARMRAPGDPSGWAEAAE